MRYQRKSTKQAIQYYQSLVKQQHLLELENQWRLGRLINKAQAKAYVEMELEHYHI